MKTLFKLLILVVLIVIVIKYVKPANEWGHENLPQQLMEFIGEEPQDMLPKEVIRYVLDGAGDAVDKLKEMVE